MPQKEETKKNNTFVNLEDAEYDESEEYEESEVDEEEASHAWEDYAMGI